MREALDHWPFVIGAYGVAGVAVGFLIAFSYQAMRKAERRRAQMRNR